MINIKGTCYYCGEQADGSVTGCNNRIVCSSTCADNLRSAHTASAHGFQPPAASAETATAGSIRAQISELVSKYRVADDENAQAIGTKAVKADNGKPPMALLDPLALREMAKVLGHGSEKYEAHNWRKGMEWSRLYSAALRHLFASLGGDDLDAETSISHLAHAAVDLMFLLNYQLTGKGTDDRAK